MKIKTLSTLIATSTTLQRTKKDEPPQAQERRIFWYILFVTTLAIMLMMVPSIQLLQQIAELTLQVKKTINSVKQAKAIPTVVSQPWTDIWEEPKSSQELFDNETKIIWGYWDTGLEEMPFLAQHAVESWKVRNPNWRVIILDDSTYQQYVSVSDLPTTFFSLKVQHRSDFLRLAVLLRYGGIYMDASTLVFKGFDGIWDTVSDDKLMLTSLNKLAHSKLDLFNNGLLMTKTTNNKALKL